MRLTVKFGATLIAGVNKHRSEVNAGERKSLIFFTFDPVSRGCSGVSHTHKHTHTRTHTLPSAEKAPNTRVLCARTDYEERTRQLAKRGASTRFAASLVTFIPQTSAPGRVQAAFPTVRCRAMSAKHFRTPSRCCCSPCLPPDPFAFPFLCESSARTVGV